MSYLIFSPSGVSRSISDRIMVLSLLPEQSGGWLAQLGVKILFIDLGSPWENGYIEFSNGKLRDELLNREIITTFQEAKVLIK